MDSRDENRREIISQCVMSEGKPTPEKTYTDPSMYAGDFAYRTRIAITISL